MSMNDTLLRLVRDVNDIKAALRRVVSNLPLYDIASENSPPALSTDQNNYVPGNYDVIRLSSTNNVSITGIAGGKKGRTLRIINVGNYIINLQHENSLSLAKNRIRSSSNNTIFIYPNSFEDLYYDSVYERWIATFGLKITARQGGNENNWNTPGSSNYTQVSNARLQLGVFDISISDASSGSGTIYYPFPYINPPWASITRKYVSADLSPTQAVTDFGVQTITNELLTVGITFNSPVTTTLRIYWITIGV